MKNRITAASAFLALLKDEGITHLFAIRHHRIADHARPEGSS